MFMLHRWLCLRKCLLLSLDSWALFGFSSYCSLHTAHHCALGQQEKFCVVNLNISNINRVLYNSFRIISGVPHLWKFHDVNLPSRWHRDILGRTPSSSLVRMINDNVCLHLCSTRSRSAWTRRSPPARGRAAGSPVPRPWTCRGPVQYSTVQYSTVQYSK